MNGTRERRRAALEERIREAATELLGEGRLTMRALARRIEYSPSALYEYYKSKDQLIDALAAQLCEELVVELRCCQGLPELMRVHFEYLADKPARIHLLDAVFFGGKPERIPPALDEMVDLFRGSIKELGVVEVELALSVLRAFLMGLTHLMKTGADRTLCERTLEQGVETLMNGWRS